MLRGMQIVAEVNLLIQFIFFVTGLRDFTQMLFLTHVIDIIAIGMVVQWLQPYVYKQENLCNLLNTRDFTTYSPAELLKRVGDVYKQAGNDYKQAMYDYSYTAGDLTSLHI